MCVTGGAPPPVPVFRDGPNDCRRGVASSPSSVACSRHDDGRVGDVENAGVFDGVFQGAVGGRSGSPAVHGAGIVHRRDGSALGPGRRLDGPGIQSPDTVGTDTDSLRAREGATPDRLDPRSAAGAPHDFSRGSLPPSPDPWHWARSTGRVAPLGRGQSKSGRKPRGLGPKAAARADGS